jgi:hypothetical protein
MGVYIGDSLQSSPACYGHVNSRFHLFGINSLHSDELLLLGKEPLFGSICATIVQPEFQRFTLPIDAFFPCFVGSSEILYLPHILVAGELCYRQEPAIGGWNGPEVISGAK